MQSAAKETPAHADKNDSEAPWRNTLCPIARLPDELLASIFVHIAQYYYITYKPPHKENAPKWINVSYVCTHWRNVALNYPTLWSFMITPSAPWARALLARSKSVPLKLADLESSKKKWSRLKTELRTSGHAERIGALRLSIHLGDTEDHHLFASATHLQDLELSIQDSAFRRHNGNAQLLEALGACRLGGLKMLHLHDISPNARVKIPAFLPTLSSMQALTHLYLDEAFLDHTEFIDSTAFRSFHKIKLPHLSHLSLTASVPTVATFLSAIEISTQTMTQLTTLSNHYPSLDEYRPLHTALAQTYSTDWAPKIHSVIFDSCYGLAPVMFVSGTSALTYHDLSKYSSEWNHDVPLKITVVGRRTVEHGYERYEDYRDTVYSHLCLAMPAVAHAQRLYVASPSPHPSFWKTLGHLSRVRYLMLHSGEVPELMDWGSDSNAWLPALEELELFEMRFREQWARVGVRSGGKWIQIASVESFRDVLESRTRGVRLMMTECFAIECDFLGDPRLDHPGW